MISVKEQFSNACGCGSASSGYVGFDGDNETDEQTSDYLGFSGTDEQGEFDEFIGKKAKEKRAIKKELMAQGVSRKDARQQAREKVGGGGVMDAIQAAKDKIQEFRDKTGIGAGAGTAGGGENTGGGSTGGGENTGGGLKGADTDTDTDSEAFNWKPYAIWGGVGIAVLAIGFIAYRKFAKK
jgi:hypothetical protein